MHDRPNLTALAAVLAGVVAGCITGPAGAQILPRIPPAPVPTPPYVPAPTPKPADLKQPEPEAEVPPLAFKDEAGAIREFDASPEETVVRSIRFKPEQQAKVDASLGARSRELEKWAVENLDKVKTASAARADLENLKDFNQFFKAKEAANALQQENLLDRLVRDGAISTLLRVHIDRVTNEYADARKATWETKTGPDVMKIAGMVGRQSFLDQTRDVFAALDRLIDRAAPGLGSSVTGLGIPQEQAARIGGLAAALVDGRKTLGPATAGARAALRDALFEALTTDQLKGLLVPHITPPASATP